MAVGDIWDVRIDMSVHDRASGFNFWAETKTESSNDNDGLLLARSVLVHFELELRQILSNEARYEGVRCWKRRGVQAVPGHAFQNDGTGTISAQPLPANNCVRLQFRQDVHDAKYNNSLSISGAPETNAADSFFDDAYIDGAVTTLANRFLAVITEVSAGPGRWNAINIARRLPLNPPGDPADLQDVVPVRRVMSAKKRTTRVEGTSLATG